MPSVSLTLCLKSSVRWPLCLLLCVLGIGPPNLSTEMVDTTSGESRSWPHVTGQDGSAGALNVSHKTSLQAMCIRCVGTHTIGLGIQPQGLSLYEHASALLQNLGRLRYPEDFCFWAFEGCWALVISLSYALSVSSPAQLSKAYQFQDQTLLFLAPKAALAQPPML